MMGFDAVAGTAAGDSMTGDVLGAEERSVAAQL